MKPPTNRLFEIFRRLDGSKFYAQMTENSTYISTSKSPKKLLVVQSPSIVEIGDVVKTHTGAKIILLRYPKSNKWSNLYIAADVDGEYLWERRVKEIDSVAKIERDVGFVELGILFITIDQMEDLQVDQMTTSTWSFYTGQDVQIGDLVDGKQVSHIKEVLGVKFVTTK